MKVIQSRAVDQALRTLDAEDRRRVRAWIDHLRNWEHDEPLRRMAKATVDPDTLVLNTSHDLRIFFALNEANTEIVIVDLAKPSRFEIAGAASE